MSVLRRETYSNNTKEIQMLIRLAVALALVLIPQAAFGQVVAYDMVGSTSQNLISHTNPWDGGFTSAGDGFQKFQRGVSPSIPFSVVDDSLVIFPADSLGIIKDGNTDVFFGVTDTVNGDTSAGVVATWVFDISGASGLELSIDMGAMGDFESSDHFSWTYSIDGSAAAPAFENAVDEAGSHTYTLEGGASFTLNDPMLMQGTILTNDLQTFVAPIAGTGNQLTLVLTAYTDGGSEAFAFQNIVITGSVPTEIAYDMVGSASQNLISHTNPWDGGFTSAGDGFQKFQRGVSPSIPFSIVDDSLVIFPADSLGIIKDGNTDVFFGVTDTVNGDTSGPVTANWTFDISGASGLSVSIDMGAMGDFESSDVFEWTYSIDGGATATAFVNSVDEAGSHTYTLEGGASFTLNDPMLMQGTILTNDLQNFVAPIAGTGSQLTLTLTASTDGGSEAFAFQNIIIRGGSGGPPTSPFIINETDADTAGSDTLEFVELYDGGMGNVSLDGLTVVFFNGSDDASYNAFDLDGYTTNATGYFVLGNSSVSPSPGIVFPGNGLQNGADAVALYQADGADFPNDTPVTTDGLIDAIVYDTNDSDDAGLLVLLNPGQPQVNEGGEGNKDGHSNQRCPNGEGGPRNTETFLQRPPTPGSENQCSALPELLEIFDIQGPGAASPADGLLVTSLENVVTAVSPDGFFIQTPAARSDGDVDTSDGIFVYTGGVPTVVVGDLVDVTGTVQEFFGMTEISGSPVVTVVSSGNSLPPAVSFDAFVPSPDPMFPSCAIEYECYEGMLVEVVTGTVAASNQSFGSDPFAEIHVVARSGRAFREPGIEFPGLVDLPVWDGNPEVFELDADKLGLPFGFIPAGSAFSATGVIGFEFNHYELWPTALTINDLAVLPAPVRPAGPNELTVGSLNLFRMFAGDTKLSSYIHGVLRSPDILAVQEVDSLSVLEALAGQIFADTSGAVDYTAYLEEGNDIGGIDVGFLVRQGIAVTSVTQLGADELFYFDDPASLLHDRPPLLLEAISDGAFPIKVMVLHMRSLNGIETERTQQKRFEQAESVAQMVQDIQDADPYVHLAVVGDFNAFEFTDGYVDLAGIIKGDFAPEDSLACDFNTCSDLVDPDLTDEVLLIPTAERYSFVFRDKFNPAGSRGDAQVLDHAMTSAGLGDLVQALEYGRGNADAAEELLDDNGTLAPLSLRSSDHDGLVLYLFKDEDHDGIPDAEDYCLGTMIPEGVPTRSLGVNRWALVDEDGVFDTTLPNGKGNGLDRSFTIEDTAGCSCEQIIDELHLGKGHEKFGCSDGAMENWVSEMQD
jgi:hypothetical protein